MKTAVVVFPGSNCDRDVAVAIETVTGKKPQMLWHAETSLPKGLDFIAVPGGFSYGDYLRSGAMAAKSPLMREIVKAANQGTYVLGICNGFQILTEAGLLPGVLMRNRDLKFICKPVYLRVANNDTAFTRRYQAEQVVRIPIAHHDGNYYADHATLYQLEENNQIAFYYTNEDGHAKENANPNGSVQNIAGIFNARKNVLGMMPHPERVADILTGGTDGETLFESVMG